MLTCRLFQTFSTSPSVLFFVQPLSKNSVINMSSILTFTFRQIFDQNFSSLLNDIFLYWMTSTLMSTVLICWYRKQPMWISSLLFSGTAWSTSRCWLSCTVWVKKSPRPAACGFLTFFDKRFRILNQFWHRQNSFNIKINHSNRLFQTTRSIKRIKERIQRDRQ